MWSGSKQKSIAEVERLVREVLLHPYFKTSDLPANFSISRETAKLDKQLATEKDGWFEQDVIIDVPDGNPHSSSNDPPLPQFTVHSLHRRSIVEVIKTAWSEPRSRYFHFTPFKQLWTRLDGVVERLYGELFTTDSWLTAQKALQEMPGEPGCKLERVICSLMFWSDSTHLANFGTASLWPVYLFFGNESKYIRGKPSSGACHHLAYIPKVGYHLAHASTFLLIAF